MSTSRPSRSSLKSESREQAGDARVTSHREAGAGSLALLHAVAGNAAVSRLLRGEVEARDRLEMIRGELGGERLIAQEVVDVIKEAETRERGSHAGRALQHAAEDQAKGLPSQGSTPTGSVRPHDRRTAPVRARANKAAAETDERKPPPEAARQGMEEAVLELQRAAGNHANREALGSGLPNGLRAEFEERFSADLADVRIHSDAEADRRARAEHATAFTRGADIYFREGLYQPNTEAGRVVLAHELVHVVQQTQNPTGPQRATYELEKEANTAAIAPTTTVRGNASQGTVQRADEPDPKEFELRLGGKAGERGVGVLRVTQGRWKELSPAEQERIRAWANLVDLQASDPEGLTRQTVDVASREAGNRVASWASRPRLKKGLPEGYSGVSKTQAWGHASDIAGGGEPAAVGLGIDRKVNSQIGGQWKRYEPGFVFTGISIYDEETGEWIYTSRALEHEPPPMPAASKKGVKGAPASASTTGQAGAGVDPKAKTTTGAATTKATEGTAKSQPAQPSELTKAASQTEPPNAAAAAEARKPAPQTEPKAAAPSESIKPAAPAEGTKPATAAEPPKPASSTQLTKPATEVTVKPEVLERYTAYPTVEVIVEPPSQMTAKAKPGAPVEGTKVPAPVAVTKGAAPVAATTPARVLEPPKAAPSPEAPKAPAVRAPTSSRPTSKTAAEAPPERLPAAVVTPKPAVEATESLAKATPRGIEATPVAKVPQASEIAGKGQEPGGRPFERLLTDPNIRKMVGAPETEVPISATPPVSKGASVAQSVGEGVAAWAGPAIDFLNAVGVAHRVKEELEGKLPGIDDFRAKNPGQGVLVVIQRQEHPPPIDPDLPYVKESFLSLFTVPGGRTKEEAVTHYTAEPQMTRGPEGMPGTKVLQEFMWVPPLKQ